MTDDEPDEADEREPLRHQDFIIGQEFETATGRWRCTDVGTRTIVAIKISDHDDPSWFNGPSYAVAELVFDEDDFEGETCWRTQLPRRDAVQGGSEGRTDDEAPSDGTTDAEAGGEGDVRLLDVDGIAGPAARLRVTTEGVELTFLAERRAGFLAWLTDDAAGHVYRLMRKHERWADVEEMIASWPAEEGNEDRSGPL